MKFSLWLIWIKRVPWTYRWFIYLVLLRPLIDNFYYLKYTSPFLSPLNIAGVLTPVLCTYAVINSRKPINTLSDSLFKMWSVILFITSAFLVFIYSFNIDSLALFLKISLPVFLFPFLRIFINSRENLYGILQTFLYSCVIAIIIFIIAKFTGQSGVTFTRGVERLSGFYADVANLGFYISLGFLISAYFNLLARKTNSYYSKPLYLITVIIICVAGIASINHVTTFAVFLTLLLLYLIFALRKSLSYSFFIILFLGAFYFIFGQKLIDESVTPLLTDEFEVLRGERDQSQLLHGRMSRWPEMFGLFLSLNPTAIFLGSSFSFKKEIIVLVTGIVHNDFLRILFSTGILGFILYLSFLFTLYRKVGTLVRQDKFLGFGALIIITLYSITMVPNFYPNLCYILYSIFAFLLLPSSVKYGNKAV